MMRAGQRNGGTTMEALSDGSAHMLLPGDKGLAETDAIVQALYHDTYKGPGPRRHVQVHGAFGPLASWLATANRAPKRTQPGLYRSRSGLDCALKRNLERKSCEQRSARARTLIPRGP
jgi:hypothetical protein